MFFYVPSFGSAGLPAGNTDSQAQCPHFDASPDQSGSTVLRLLEPGKIET
jgi:hypothetical protein